MRIEQPERSEEPALSCRRNLAVLSVCPLCDRKCVSAQTTPAAWSGRNKNPLRRRGGHVPGGKRAG